MKFSRMKNDEGGKRSMDKILRFAGFLAAASCIMLFMAAMPVYAVQEITVDAVGSDITAFDYGDVLVDASAIQTFVVRNVGTNDGTEEDLEITGIELTGADADQFTIESGDGAVTLAPDESQDIVVSFNPTSTGSKSATLSISSNDSDENPYDVALTGNALDSPDITIDPDTWGGDVVEGTNLPITFTIGNIGTANLEISGISLSVGSSGDFDITTDPPTSLPATVSPGGTVTVEVTYTPSNIGPDTGTLVIASDDPDENPLEVELEGFGVSPADNLPSEQISGGVGYQDFAYGGQVYELPTAEKPESKLWWLDGFWWGCLWDPVRQVYRIHRFDPSEQRWVNTGPAINDDRELILVDTLWDDTEEKLYILSHIVSNTQGVAGPARLSRYSYDSGSDEYTSDWGFQANIGDTASAEAVTLAKDSNGKLWITWEKDNQIWVNRTTSNDVTWGSRFAISATDVDSDDISAIVAFGGDKIGVMWSDQDEVDGDSKFFFSMHNDSDSDTNWTTPEVAYAVVGKNAANDHLNLKAFGGEVYALVMTEMFRDQVPDDPDMNVLKRDSDGRWSVSLYGTVTDFHERPLMMINEEDEVMYAIAVGEEALEGRIRIKTSGLETVVFPTGLGDVFMESSYPLLNYPTSTKQNINNTTGLLVAASERNFRHYFHRYLTGGDLPLPAINITVTPSAGDFGDVVENTSSPTITFTVANNSSATASLDLASVTITGDDASEFEIVSGNSGPAIAPGSSRDIEVRFNPTSAGAKSATLSLSISGYYGTVDVDLTGNGTAPVPDISVTPTSGDYGDVEVGMNSSSQTFTVENAATATGDLVVDPLTAPNEFEIVSGGGGFTLAPGEAQGIEVRFTPTSVGAKSATLQVNSNDQDNPTIDVTLNGTGVTPEDNDGDGLPDSWEQQIIEDNPSDDIDSIEDVLPGDDYDGDGLTNLEEFEAGANPINARPDAPVLDLPANDQGGESLAPTLTTLAEFNDPDGHAYTRWQISTAPFPADTDPEPDDLVFDLTSDTQLVMLEVTYLVLEVNTDYYWRAQFIDGADQESVWAQYRRFTTIVDCPTDTSGQYCLPDTQQVNCADIFDPDPPPNTICVDPGDGNAIGIEGSANVTSIEAFTWIDPADMPEELGNVELALGLFGFRATCNPGDTIEIIYRTDQPIPAGAQFWNYNPNNGWQLIESPGGNVVISGDRQSATMTYLEGGRFDSDGVENGVFIDPSGPGVAATSGGGGGGGGGSSSRGCFIATSKDASPMPQKIPALLLLLGSGWF